MSATDYDEAERLFCGNWENVGNELDDFWEAGEFPDDFKLYIAQERRISLTRVDNSFHFKTKAGDLEIDFATKIGEKTEWKGKEEDPIFHLGVEVLSFKDGVWTMDFTPLKPNGGKRHCLVVTIQDGKMVYDLTLPDCPGVRGKRVFKRCD